jgi:hypothetical protein
MSRISPPQRFRRIVLAAGLLIWTAIVVLRAQQSAALIGREVSVPRHLSDGEEYTLPLAELLSYGQRLFTANWTIEEGAGRPLSKGTGAPLSDPTSPLLFPRNFNRVSGPEANSCAGCHNSPFGRPGGSGDLVTSVFVLAQRFDFATFDGNDMEPARGAIAETGSHVTLQTIGNSRKTISMFGSGYIEMLARQITSDLQQTREALLPGRSAPLSSSGISFGVLTHNGDGTWDTSRVAGLAPPSLASSAASPPSLLIRPFHQAGVVISLRQFTNNAFNHHHGIQSAERFGDGTDPDGDGFVNELTRADVTAVALFQATMPVPGRVIPDDPDVEAAVLAGERLFDRVGCTSCHIPRLPLRYPGGMFTEPNPFNPPGNLQAAGSRSVAVDLGRSDLPQPRAEQDGNVTWVEAYTDFKLHDITNGQTDPNHEPLDQQAAPNAEGFTAGNGRFITRRLWGVANQPPYFHHGLFTTMRQAILAHAGEATGQRSAFQAMTTYQQDCVVEFLKTLRVLPAGTKWRIVNEKGEPKDWPRRGG